MTSLPRVLVIAYYFPPIGGIGSIRLAGFAAHLPQFGWEPTVLAPLRTPHPSDPTIRVREENVIRTRSLEPSLLMHHRRAATPRTKAMQSCPPPPARSAARTAVMRRVFFPDPQVGWYPSAVRAGLRLARSSEFDAIFSSAFPVTAHLIAGSVSRRSGLPWVAEFRDPWSERIPASHRRAAQRLERGIAQEASRVVVPSATLAEYFGRLWGIDVAAIPNGCDRLPAVPHARPDPPVLAHVGTYYPARQSLRAVWRALAELRRAGEPIPRIQWVGDLPYDGRTEIEACGLADILDVTGFVAKEEATRLMRSSTMLIASGELDTGPLGRGTTAAKLFDYLASDLPILFVGDLRSDPALMLQDHAGCHVVAFGDVSAARAALRAGLVGDRYDRDVESISRRARTADLAAILTSVLSPS